MTPLEKLLDSFEEEFRDKGDKKYGWVAHNNAIVSRQMDWLRDKLPLIFEAGVKAENARVLAAVPEEKDTMDFAEHWKAYHAEGWNACRSELLRAITNDGQ